MSDRQVTITDEDVEFLRVAHKHYGILAGLGEKRGDDVTSGVMRKQEFYAERFLLRVTEGKEPKE